MPCSKGGDNSSCSGASDVSDDLSPHSGRSTDDICRDFLRNVCKRGSRCKYRHPGRDEIKNLGCQPDYQFSHDYQNTGCQRTACKFIHCPREEEEFYKQTGQLPQRLQQTVVMGIGVTSPSYPVIQGNVPICKDHLKGECKRSSRCKFRHLTPAKYEAEIRKQRKDHLPRRKCPPVTGAHVPPDGAAVVDL